MSPRAAWRLEALGFESVFEYAAGIADWAAAGLPVEGELSEVPTIGQIARKNVPLAHLDDRVGDVRRKAEEGGWDTALVVNAGNVVLGRLFKSQLDSDPKATVESVMKPGPSTFRPNVSAPEMDESMRQNELTTAPVTTSEGVLVGMVFREDIDRALEEFNKTHRHAEA